MLENHHVATAFRLLMDKACDWTSALEAAEYKDFRETTIAMVLGTDMRAHFEHLTKFKVLEIRSPRSRFTEPLGEVD